MEKVTEQAKEPVLNEVRPCRHVQEQGDAIYQQVGLLGLCEYCWDNYQEARYDR